MNMFEINKIRCHKGGGWNPVRVEGDSIIGTKGFFNAFDFLSFFKWRFDLVLMCECKS